MNKIKFVINRNRHVFSQNKGFYLSYMKYTKRENEQCLQHNDPKLYQEKSHSDLEFEKLNPCLLLLY